MKLQNGRPADTTGRLEKELRCYDLLDRLGVPYERVDHAPAMTMEVCQEIDRELSAQIGSARLSFAKAEYMQQLLDITPGSVSVLGLMNDTAHKVQLLIDEDVLASEYVGCHPCINTSSLRLRTRDLVEKILPAIEHEFIKVKL